jgi:urease accessory protein
MTSWTVNSGRAAVRDVMEDRAGRGRSPRTRLNMDDPNSVDLDELAQLQLLHLADSALPIGAMAHSFGLETMVAEQGLQVEDLSAFFSDWLAGAGRVEAFYCLQAHGTEDAASWFLLNAELTARKPARESREASLSLGRRFLRLARGLVDDPRLAVQEPAHLATAFGLTNGVLGIDNRRGAAAYLHQSLYGAISACQRLMPLGQSAAATLLWSLKPRILQTVADVSGLGPDDLWNPQPLLEFASMRHPRLSTRLFIS